MFQWKLNHIGYKWQEGKGPEVVIKLLSKTTAQHDKGQKKRIYRTPLKVAEYFWFDPPKY